ncbi:hypothetical protein ABPG72_009044 [Tetrahymena utriculariae]
MSSSIRPQQYPYQNPQLGYFDNQEFNRYEDSFFNGPSDNYCGQNNETPTPNPDYYECHSCFDEDILNNQQQYLQYPNQQSAQSQFQTMPSPYNIKLYGCDQQLQNQPNFNFIQSNYTDQLIKSDQIYARGQIDDYSEHQKDSDQSTDAQIQSQQDKICTNQKEKVKTGNNNTFLNKLIDQLYSNEDIPEDQISQLNDEERAVFQSIKSQNQSQQESTTPNPLFMQQDREDANDQENNPQDLLKLEMEIEQSKNLLPSFQLQSDQPIQADFLKEDNHHQNLPNQKGFSQKKSKQNSFKSSQACSHQNNQKNKKKQKRVEEMQKMIFKKSFKHVENQYYRERISKSRISSKDKANLKFYEDYFGQTAQDHRIPLKNFYHPQKQIKKGQKTKENTPGQKSFNQAYISLILKSGSFRQKIKYYIDNLILEQIQQERKSKIAKVIANLKKKYQQIEKELQKKNIMAPDKQQSTPQSDMSYYWESTKESDDNQPDEMKAQIKSENFKKIIQKLEDYIQTNSKIKLPWTDSQIKQAITLARCTITQAEDDC